MGWRSRSAADVAVNHHVVTLPRTCFLVMWVSVNAGWLLMSCSTVCWFQARGAWSSCHVRVFSVLASVATRLQARQAPFVAFVKESLDVVVCCVCWLPFLPRHLDWGVDGFNEDALLAGPAQDGVWRVGLATRMRPMMFLWGPCMCCFQPHVSCMAAAAVVGSVWIQSPNALRGRSSAVIRVLWLMYCSSKMTQSVSVCFVVW